MNTTPILLGAFLCASMAVFGAEIKPVPVVQAVSKADTTRRVYPGEIRAPRRVDLGFNVSGELEFLDAKEGRQVKQGELIARLDPRNYQYSVDMAEAGFTQSKLEYERQKELYGQRVISESVFERVKAGYISAEAQYNAARKALEDTEIRAPYDCRIAKRHVENYTQVNAMVPVVSLYDISVLEVTADIPESSIIKGQKDALQSITIKLASLPTAQIKAELSEFSISPNQATNTYQAVFQFLPPEGYNLLPGMSVSVVVELRDRSSSESVLVPVQSVVTDDGIHSYVWIIPGNGGKPEKRQIVTGSVIGGKIEALSGVNADEYIATAGLNALSSETEVRPVAADKIGLNR